ncbi:hypothetical protein V8B97DRAFT_1872863, partial [Scleroderma yunnanense]
HHKALTKNLTLVLPLAIIAHMQAQCMSILDSKEIVTFQHMLYPSLESFLKELDHTKPHQKWSKQFLEPLRRMEVESLGDMDMVTPESLYIFFKLPPVLIMDLFVQVYDVIKSIHHTKY